MSRALPKWKKKLPASLRKHVDEWVTPATLRNVLGLAKASPTCHECVRILSLLAKK